MNSCVRGSRYRKAVPKQIRRETTCLLWEDHYKCFSYANNLSGKEYWEAKQVNAETELDFVIRYCSEISALDTEHFRILFRGNIYNITFIDNVQYKNKTVKIRAALAKR